MTAKICAFLRRDEGAVTVDFTTVVAGVIGLGQASVTVISAGQNGLAASIRTALQGAYVAGNTLIHNDFDDVDGLIRTGWGWRARVDYGGWRAQTGDGDFEIIPSGYGGIETDDGANMLDMGGSPGNLHMGRTIAGLVVGSEHSVTLNAADIVGNNRVDVYFGGELIGTVEPGRSMEEYAFTFTAGSGDGSDELVLVEAGTRDNIGTYIHNIRIR